MKKRNIFVMALLAGMSFQAEAQTKGEVSGFVLDRQGNPINGAVITSEEQPGLAAYTDRNGHFTIRKAGELNITTPDKSTKKVTVVAGTPLTIVMDKWDAPVNIGYDRTFTNAQSTAATAMVSGETLAKRTSRDIKNALIGYLPGWISKQSSGTYANNSVSGYVRGQHSLSTNSAIFLVDGVQRDPSYIVPEEVESVTVLKDAAAIALYGYEGVDGVINIVTKRGKNNAREVKFSYDHIINFQARRPKFVDAYTYANAYNEALGYEGQAPKYSDNELNAFRTGQYPYLYPNVNWLDETYKNTSATNIYNASFRGGSSNFKYYTLVQLQTSKGFIKSPNENDGYSTQDKYSRANLRTNLDITVTKNTHLEVNVLGMLSESSKPGDNANLWSMLYSLPSAAIPAKTEDGLWAGSASWDGVNNPIAQSQAAGYTKNHLRALNADMTLKQDFSSILPGLKGSLKIAYDNLSLIQEDRSKTYRYASDNVTDWVDGEPVIGNRYTNGKDSELGQSAALNSYTRNFFFDGVVSYDRTFGEHSLYSQLRWDYRYTNSKGLSTTFYHQNVSLYTHYGYKDRYLFDLILVGSAANRLAPGHKWALSPTVSAAWVLSKEKFLQDISWLDFLKLRASFGVINTDRIPADNTFWADFYQKGSNYYSFGSNYTMLDQMGWEKGRPTPAGIAHEKGYKYNGGLDLGLFGGFTATLDGWYERRTDIWVDASGKYTNVMGQSAPYENGGTVDSWGFEAGLDYIKQFGDIKVNSGISISWQRNKIIEQLESPKIYQNLVTTGHAVNQYFGYKAIGLFKDQADIDNSPKQVLATNVYPGDIKYEDVNHDGQIDSNDLTAIGYNSACPEIYYSFHVGAEWKGLGFDMMFQGTGRYSVMLNTSAMYRPLLATTNLSQYYYDHRWTPDNLDAEFPRLASQSSPNNYQNSTFWLRNGSYLKLRNVELYYNLPKSFLKSLKFMNNAKIYVRGVDLACFDHLNGVSDPESYGVAAPLTRSVVAGLQIGF